MKNVCAEDAFEMLTFARKHGGYEAIAKICLETACKNAKAVVKMEGFYGLPLDILCEFAAQEELAIDEIDLFQAVHALFFGIYYAVYAFTVQWNFSKLC